MRGIAGVVWFDDSKTRGAWTSATVKSLWHPRNIFAKEDDGALSGLS